MALLKGSDPATCKALQVLAIKWGDVWKDRMGGSGVAKESREERLLYASAILQRDLSSFKELTMAEAAKLRQAYDDWPF